MKIAHYDETTQKLLGWYAKDTHTTIPTPNIEVNDIVWQEAIDGKANHVNLDGTFDIVDFRTQAEIDAAIITDKWNELNIYLSTLTVQRLATETEPAGFKFSANVQSLANISLEIDTMLDSDTRIWYEDWGSQEVTRQELQEAKRLASEEKQAKLLELFGA